MTYGYDLAVWTHDFPTGKFVFDPSRGRRHGAGDRIAAIAAFPGELKAAMAGARLD